MAITIISFITIIIFIIFIHEAGHFVAAKLSGVRVEEFGFGFPPRLLSVKWGETVYSLNLLPLGGFVRMAGEEDPSEPRSLAGKSVATRLLVLSAGSLMNALAPILLFALSFMIPQNVIVGQVTVSEIAPASPAEEAGLEPGDIILEMNGRSVENLGDLSYYTHLYLGSEVRMVVDKGEAAPVEVTLIPRWDPPPEQGPIGITLTLENHQAVTESHPLWQSIAMGARRYIDTLIILKNEVARWFIAGAGPQLAGPIGIAQITGEVAKVGIAPLLHFSAVLSLNLAIINILPIPALDGGRIMFLFLEVIRRGKRISPQREGLIHLIGFAILMTLIVVISYYDILRIIRGEGILP